MAQILKISDGATTVDFMATPDVYRVISWVPAVAHRKTGVTGGRGSYADVVEEMVISITAADPLPHLETLIGLFDQAQRWERGEPVAAVLLHYQATSGGEELKSAIRGAAGDDVPMVELPPNLLLSQVTGILDNVRLVFRRSGLWLGAEETVTASAVGNGVTTATALYTAAAAVESPIRLAMTGLVENISHVANSYILMTGAATATEAAKRLVTIHAEDLTNSGLFTVETDTDNNAITGNILRFQHSGPDGWATSATETVSSVVSSNVRRWAIFVNWRNNSATTNFQVRFQFYAGAAELPPSQSLIIPAGITDPQWSFVSTVSLPPLSPLTALLMEVLASDTSGTIDFDTIVLMAADNPATDCVVGILPGQLGSISSASLVIGGHPLTYPVGSVFLDETNGDIHLGYTGDPALYIAPGARSIAASWLTTDGANWRAIRISGGAIMNAAFSAVRRRGYLTPR